MRLVEQKQRQAVVRELPDVVDLFALSFSAGLTVPLAARAVGEVGHGLVAESIRMAADQVDTGLRWSEALHGVLDDLGDPVRRLIRLLLDMLDGTDPGGIIEQIAVEARRDRQRRAEYRSGCCSRWSPASCQHLVCSPWCRWSPDRSNHLPPSYSLSPQKHCNRGAQVVPPTIRVGRLIYVKSTLFSTVTIIHAEAQLGCSGAEFASQVDQVAFRARAVDG